MSLNVSTCQSCQFYSSSWDWIAFSVLFKSLDENSRMMICVACLKKCKARKTKEVQKQIYLVKLSVLIFWSDKAVKVFCLILMCHIDFGYKKLSNIFRPVCYCPKPELSYYERVTLCKLIFIHSTIFMSQRDDYDSDNVGGCFCRIELWCFPQFFCPICNTFETRLNMLFIPNTAGEGYIYCNAKRTVKISRI